MRGVGAAGASANQWWTRRLIPPVKASAPSTRSGQVRFFGAATPYFMFGLAPRPTGSETYDCNVYPLPAVKDAAQIDLVYAETKIPAGETIRKELYGYFGPSYLDKFEHADDVAGFKMGLRDTVDFGWFSFISKPLLWLLRHIYGLVGNWGIAIPYHSNAAEIYLPSVVQQTANGLTVGQTLPEYRVGGSRGTNCAATGGCTMAQAFPVPAELRTLHHVAGGAFLSASDLMQATLPTR